MGKKPGSKDVIAWPEPREVDQLFLHMAETGAEVKRLKEYLEKM